MEADSALYVLIGVILLGFAVYLFIGGVKG